MEQCGTQLLYFLLVFSMKMKWTLADFTEMNEQFTFRIAKPEKGVCQGVSLDSTACNSFQGYVRQFGFHRARYPWGGGDAFRLSLGWFGCFDWFGGFSLLCALVGQMIGSFICLMTHLLFVRSFFRSVLSSCFFPLGIRPFFTSYSSVSVCLCLYYFTASCWNEKWSL